MFWSRVICLFHQHWEDEKNPFVNDINDRFHVDTLDLYHSRSRRAYLQEAAEEVGLNENDLRSDLGRVLLKLEELEEDNRTTGQRKEKPVFLRASINFSIKALYAGSYNRKLMSALSGHKMAFSVQPMLDYVVINNKYDPVYGLKMNMRF